MQDIKDFEPLWGEWYSVELLGQGSFGRVYKMVKKDLDKEYYAAVKHLSLPQEPGEEKGLYAEGLVSDQETLKTYYDDVLKNLRSEIDLCYKLKGITNIVSYEDHYIRPKSTGAGYDIFIKMELLTDLQDRLKEGGLTVWDVVKLGEDICKALAVLRRERIIHRDIKPGNIFINSGGDYKLGDFGVSRSMERTVSSMSVKGTFTYMAPEVAKGSTGDYRVDIYSLGLVLYRLLNKNRAPFCPLPPASVTKAVHELAQERRLKGDPLPPPADADEALGKIILKACAYRPEDRWESAEAMGKALAEYRLGLKRPEPASPKAEAPAPAPHPVENPPAEPDDMTELLPHGVPPKPEPIEEGTQILGGAAPTDLNTFQPFEPAPEPADTGSSAPADSPAPPPQTFTGKLKPPIIAAAAAVVVLVGVGAFALFSRPSDSPDPSGPDIQSAFQPSSASVLPSDNTPEPILWHDPLIRDTVLAGLNTDEASLTLEDLAGVTELSLPEPEGDSQDEPAIPVTTLEDLSMLTGLASLKLNGHPVEQFDFPEDMAQLQMLQLAGCGCTDLEFLAHPRLQHLEQLNLSYNDITDLTLVSGLSELAGLNISHTRVSSLAPLEGLSSLASLWAADIPAEDWSAVEHVAWVEGRPEEPEEPQQPEEPQKPAETTKPNTNKPSKPNNSTTTKPANPGTTTPSNPGTTTPSTQPPPSEPTTVAVSSVSVSPSEALLSEGGSVRLSAGVSPSNATNQKVSWSSSNSSVATVDGSGHVNAVGRGTARITASCDGKSGSCTITVD